MKKLIFFLFGYLSLLNVLQSQPVDIDLSKEDRAFNDKIVEDAVAIVLGDVVDTLFSEGTENRFYATTHFLVRIKHIYRGHSLITSDLIEIEAPGGIYYDAKALQGIEPPYGGVDVSGHNSVGGIEKILRLSTDVILFISKKNAKRWFKSSSEAFSLNCSNGHRSAMLSFIAKADHSGDYDLSEKEQYLKKVQYNGLDFLRFNSYGELQNYLASFKDIKMPDGYGKKPNAAVVSFGGTSSNPLVALRMAFDTLLLTTDNKIITEDAQGKEYLEFDISVRKSPGTSANTYLNRLTVNFVFDTLLFGTYLLGNQHIAFSPAADAATCFDTYQIRTGNFITYDVAYNRVAAELNIDPAGEPYSRLCMTDTWQSAIHVRLQIKTCGQTSGIQFQTGTSATWTPAADSPLSAGATVYDSGVLATNPPFRLASPASICAVGDTILRLSTNSIVSGIGKKLVLYPTTNVKFGTAKGKITVTDANNATNSDELKRKYDLDMIDYQWYNDSIVIRSFSSSSLTGKSPGTGVVRVKSADGTKSWSSEGKLHVQYCIRNYRIPNSTERVRPVLANVSCMKGLKFYVDASMLRRKGYLNETLTDTLGSFPAIRRALSDWSAYFYKTTGLSLNWTLEPGFHTESSITDGVLIKYDSAVIREVMFTEWKTIDSSYTNLEVGTGSKRPQYFVRKVVITIGKPATYSFNLPGSQITGRGNFYHDILHEIGHCFGLGHIVPLKDLGYNELDLMWWESDLQSWEADAWFNHIEPIVSGTQSKIAARQQILASAPISFINSSTVLKSRNQRKVASIRLNTTGNTLPTAGQITITRTANTTPITSITLGAVDSAFIIVRPDKRPNGFTYRWYVKPPNQTEWYPIRHYGTFLDCRDSSNVRFTMRTTWGNKNICWNGFQFKAGITDGCTEVFSPVLTVSQPCTVPLGINFQNAPYNICFGTNGFNQFYAELNTADAIGQEIQVFVALNGSITNGYSISPPVLVTANISSILCTVPNIGQPAGDYSLVVINYHTLQKMNTVDGLLKIKRPSKGLSCPTFSSTLSKDMDEPHTLEQDVVRLYPNPARTELFVEVSERLYGASILMFDVQGRKIAEVKDATYQQKLDTSTLPSGLYFVQIRHEHFLKTEKVFILQE